MLLTLLTAVVWPQVEVSATANGARRVHAGVDADAVVTPAWNWEPGRITGSSSDCDAQQIAQLTGCDSEGRAVYWFPPGAAFQPQFILDAKAVSRDLEQQEANRLLYVALTRACEGLVVAGWEKPHGVRVLDSSDYALIRSALATLPGVVETDDGHMRLDIAATHITEATGADRAALPPHRAVVSTDSDWIARPAPIDAPSGRPLRPSQPGLDHAPSTLAPPCIAQTSERPLTFLSSTAMGMTRLQW